MNLERMTLRELIALYNEHSGRRPIRPFRDKTTAIQRVRSVLAPAASREPSDMDVSMLAKPITVDDLANLLGTTSKGARGHIDRARRSGHNVVNCGRCTFVLK